MAGIDNVSRRLQTSGLRSTAPRRAVLEVLDEGGHKDAATVYQKIKEELTGTSLQAVYGVLTALTEAGLARKIEVSGGASALYEARVGDNHHHLICINCGRIEDVACVIGEAPCLTPSNDHGFQIYTAEVTFTGLCSDCSSATKSNL